jgi:hypothetical protein
MLTRNAAQLAPAAGPDRSGGSVGSRPHVGVAAGKPSARARARAAQSESGQGADRAGPDSVPPHPPTPRRPPCPASAHPPRGCGRAPRGEDRLASRGGGRRPRHPRVRAAEGPLPRTPSRTMLWGCAATVDLAARGARHPPPRLPGAGLGRGGRDQSPPPGALPTPWATRRLRQTNRFQTNRFKESVGAQQTRAGSPPRKALHSSHGTCGGEAGSGSFGCHRHCRSSASRASAAAAACASPAACSIQPSRGDTHGRL